MTKNKGENTNAANYYKATWPELLFAHRVGSQVKISTDPDPDESGAIIAEIPNDERGEFAVELIRRWNHSPHREQALMDIRAMAQKRKSCIRMPNGMMLDSFCGQALIELSRPAGVPLTLGV